MALALSGLPTDRFFFGGFLPAKASERRRAIGAAGAGAGDAGVLRGAASACRVAGRSRRAAGRAAGRGGARAHQAVRGGAPRIARASLPRTTPRHPDVKGEIVIVIGAARRGGGAAGRRARRGAAHGAGRRLGQGCGGRSRGALWAEAPRRLCPRARAQARGRHDHDSHRHDDPGAPGGASAGPCRRMARRVAPAAGRLSVLARRYKTKLGEIDIVARRGGMLAFVEVKARADLADARPTRSAAASSAAWRARPACSWRAIRTMPPHSVRFDAVLVGGLWPRHLPDVWRRAGVMPCRLRSDDAATQQARRGCAISAPATASVSICSRRR